MTKGRETASDSPQRELRVLVVEDSIDDYDLLLRALRRAGYAPYAERVQTEAQLRTALEASTWDVVVLDHVIPGYGGPEALRLARDLVPDIAAVVVSGKVDEDVIAADIRLGADDYVLKSHLSRLAPAIETAVQAAARRREQRRAADQLRASEARLRQVLGAVAVAIWEVDLSGTVALVDRLAAEVDDLKAHLVDHPEVLAELVATIRPVDCNEWALRLLGATDREQLFAGVSQIASDTVLDRVQSEAIAIASGHDHTIGELDLRTLSGEPLRCLVNVSYPRAAEGFEHAIVAVSEIGRPWQADRALRETLDRVQVALEGADLSVYDWDVRSGGLRVDDRYFALFGYEPGGFEPTIEWWESRVHPDDHERVMEFTRRQLAGDARFEDLEYRLQTRSGGWMWVVDRGHVVERSPDGEPLRFAGTFFDVTARKAAQRELELAKERLELALEGADLGFFELDFVDDGFDCDARYLGMLGWEVGEVDVSPEWLRSLQHPDERDDHGRLLDDLRAGRQERWDLVRRQRHKDGYWVWVLTRGKVVAWAADGTPTRAVGTHLDISELKAVEEALAASEEKHRHMVEQANEGVWAMDAEHRTTFVNQRLVEMLGYEEREMLGRPVEDFMYPEDLPEHRAAMAARHAGQSGRYERRFRRKDGAEVWTIVAARPLPDADGAFAGSFGMFTDITERVRAERELADSRARLGSILDAAPAAIGLVVDRVILEVNEYMCEMLGYERDDLIGQSARLLYLDQDEYERVGREKYAQIGVGGKGSVETRWVTSDGAVLDVMLSSAVVDPHDPAKGVTFTAFDITDRLRAERESAAQRDLLSVVFESAPYIVLVLDAECRVREANRAAVDFLGRPEEALVDVLCGEAIGCAHATASLCGTGAECAACSIRTLAERAIATGGSVRDAEGRLTVRRDGAVLDVDVLVSAAPVAAEGETLCLVTVADVTERARALRALADSEARYRRVVEGTSEGLLELDADYRIVTVNERWLVMMGHEQAAVVGRPVHDFLFADDLPDLEANIELRRRGIAGRHERRFRRADGSELWAAISAVPRIADDGAFEGVVALWLDITATKAAERALGEHAERLRHTVEGAVEAMGSIVEMRDPYTAGHERRVTRLALEIGRRMDLDERCLEGLRLAGTVHDIGKITVPAEILSKPGLLQEYEMSLVRTHAQVGHDVLAAIDFERPVADIVLQHHEKLDGSGYPRGLQGEQILAEARILTVADVVEAMSSHRPYRAALGMDAALAEIRAGAGTLYDGDAVAACEQAVADGFTWEERL